MKIKIKDNNSLDKGREFKVRRMNYDQVVVNYTGEKGIEILKTDDVEFISENEFDDFLIKHRYLLKIKINRGISVVFYKYLFDELEKLIQDTIVDFKVLKDSFKIVNKRGMWEKEMVIMLNHEYSIQVSVNGEKFKKDSYRYDVKQLTEDELMEFCKFNIEKLEKDIENKNKELNMFKEIKSNVNENV